MIPVASSHHLSTLLSQRPLAPRGRSTMCLSPSSCLSTSMAMWATNRPTYMLRLNMTRPSITSNHAATLLPPACQVSHQAKKACLLPDLRSEILLVFIMSAMDTGHAMSHHSGLPTSHLPQCHISLIRSFKHRNTLAFPHPITFTTTKVQHTWIPVGPIFSTQAWSLSILLVTSVHTQSALLQPTVLHMSPSISAHRQHNIQICHLVTTSHQHLSMQSQLTANTQSQLPTIPLHPTSLFKKAVHVDASPVFSVHKAKPKATSADRKTGSFSSFAPKASPTALSKP